MQTLIPWLLQPIDPARAHEIGGLLSWHARLMVLAWGVLAPLAVLAARFCKIMPGQDWPRVLDNPFWWRIHWRGQMLVLAITALALILVLAAAAGPHPAGAHRLLGWLLVGLAGVQLVSGLMRGSKGGPTAPAADGSWRGDHYDMTRRRLIFEAVHKTLGHALLLLAMGCILLGLWAANAPNWMWICLAGWWALLLTAGLHLQRRGRAHDTYQAIWGPDPAHPGNRMPKQGWGTTRPGDAIPERRDPPCSE